MADKAITGKDIFDGDVSSLERLEKSLKEIDIVIDSLNQSAGELSKDFENLAKSSKVNSDAIKKANLLNREAEKLERERIKTLKIQEGLNREREKTIQAIATTQQKKNALAEQERKIGERLEKQNKSLNSEYKKQSATLTKLRNEAKDLALTLGQDSREFKKAAKEVQNLDKRLKSIDTELGQSQREVGNYGKAWSKATKLIGGGLAAVGITQGLGVVKDALTDAVKVTAEFGEKVSFLGAVSGASVSELKTLEKQALELGRTTQRSAGDVAQLQVELSKLGFTAKSIEDATEGILELSIATGEDLADSAAVTAGVLNAFQKDASETGEVVDIMAKAFSSSALDLQKFKVAIAPVAPVANQAGVSLERVTAELGILVDRNIDASSAGAALRNIFLDLSASGMDYDEALRQIRESSDSNAAALELFGKRGAAVASILATSQPAIEKLTTGLENSAGAAKRMSDILADNLEGDFKASASASEGLQISLGKRLEPSLRKVTKAWTNIKIATAEFLELSPEKEIEKEREEVFKLTGIIQNNNVTREEQNAALEKLQQIAPEVAKGVSLETKNYELLNDQLRVYLQNVIKRIALANLEKEREEELAEIADIRIKQGQNIIAALEATTTVNKEFVSSETDVQKKLKETIILLQEEVDRQEEAGEAGEKLVTQRGAIIDSRTDEQKALQTLINNYSAFNRLEEEANEISRESIDPLNKKINVLNDLLSVTKEPVDTDIINVEEDLANFDELVATSSEAIEEINKEVEKGQKEFLKIEGKRLAEFKRIQALLDSIRKESGELDIELVRNQFDKEERLAEVFYKLKLDEFEINQDELTAKAEESAEQLTTIERAKYTLLLQLQEEYLNKVEQNDLNRALSDLENQQALIDEKISILSSLDVYNEEAFTEQIAAEEERYALERQALAGQNEALEAAAVEHNAKMRELGIQETDAKQKELEKINELEQARIGVIRAGSQTLRTIAGENSEISKALFLFEQGLAIASIVKDTQVANAAATAAYAPLGPLGVAPLAATIATNNANMTTGIITVATQTVGELAFKDGVIGFKGEGTETSDSNVVRISNEESIIKARSSKQSTKLLTAINDGIISDKDLSMFSDYENLKASQNNVIFKTYRMERELSEIKAILKGQPIIIPLGGHKERYHNGETETFLQ